MHGFPRAKTVGQVAPRQAGLGQIKDGIHELPERDFCRTSSAITLEGQDGLETIPLVVSQFMAVHSRT